MQNIMILSGAGLSAASGLKTFRDSGGLWEQYDVREVCSAWGFRKDRQKVLKFYDERRAQLKGVEPNIAHQKIAQIKAKYPKNIAVVTQNVDDLLERAGCKEVIHLHGFLPEIRCEKCGFIWDIGYESQSDQNCPKCGSDFVRHNIIMFEEAAPAYATLYELLAKTKLLIVIGTSGEVLPVASFARSCEHSILCNLDDDPLLSAAFEKSYIEPIAEAIDKIIADIEKFMA